MICGLLPGHGKGALYYSGSMPLSRAAERGHDAVVNLLLAQDGVDADFKSSYGRTPLSMAAANGHEAVVKLLLAQDGVDPDPKESHGATPLSRAAANGHEAVVKLVQSKDQCYQEAGRLYTCRIRK
jgi:ankyrin repeat protein